MKIIKYLFGITSIILWLGCTSHKSNQDQSDSLKKTEDNTTKSEIKSTAEEPQLTGTFKGKQLAMIGKISQIGDENHGYSTYLNVKQKTDNGDLMYEFLAIYDGKLAPGTYTVTNNAMYGFNDAVEVITKGEGNTKYTMPTAYKQQSGAITITALKDNTAYGNYQVNVYKIADKNIIETVKGNFAKLPIKSVGE